jgi:hypothetical protein
MIILRSTMTIALYREIFVLFNGQLHAEVKPTLRRNCMLLINYCYYNFLFEFSVFFFVVCLAKLSVVTLYSVE